MKDEWGFFELMMLNNYVDLKGKDEDLWLEIHKFQSEDYQHTLNLVN